jgi:hypothetical protein
MKKSQNILVWLSKMVVTFVAQQFVHSLLRLVKKGTAKSLTPIVVDWLDNLGWYFTSLSPICSPSFSYLAGVGTKKANKLKLRCQK